MSNHSLDNPLLKADSARLFLNIPPRTFYQYRSHDPKFPKGVKLEKGKFAYYQKDLEVYKKLMEQGERPKTAKKAKYESTKTAQKEDSSLDTEQPKIEQSDTINRLEFTFFKMGEALENENERIIRAKEAIAFFGVSSATFYRMVKNIDGFPQPLSIGAGAKGFLMSEIRGFIQQRIQERDSNKGKQC